MIEQFSWLVTKMVRSCFVHGVEYDDLHQDGMIGLLYAARNYDPARSQSFEAYAAMCIKSRLIDSLRRHSAENRKADVLLQKLEQENNDSAEDPEELAIGEESAREIVKEVSSRLSAMEKTVFGLYLEGLAASDISQRLSFDLKSVNNAIMRIRQKIRDYINSQR